MKRHQLTNGRVQLASGSRGETNQDYSRGLHVGNEHKPAEVFVLCQQDSVVGLREFHQFPIDGSLLHFAHSQNVMAIRAERSHNREVTALVREKAHRVELTGVWSYNGLVGNGVGGVPKTSADIVGSQPRIGIKQVFE
jgi:hypothetical protein